MAFSGSRRASSIVEYCRPALLREQAKRPETLYVWRIVCRLYVAENVIWFGPEPALRAAHPDMTGWPHPTGVVYRAATQAENADRWFLPMRYPTAAPATKISETDIARIRLPFRFLRRTFGERKGGLDDCDGNNKRTAGYLLAIGAMTTINHQGRRGDFVL